MNTAETLESRWPLGWTQDTATDTAVAMLGLVRVECYVGTQGWEFVACGPGCDVQLHLVRPCNGQGFGILVRAARRQLPKWIGQWIATHEYRATEMRRAGEVLIARRRKA